MRDLDTEGVRGLFDRAKAMGRADKLGVIDQVQEMYMILRMSGFTHHEIKTHLDKAKEKYESYDLTEFYQGSGLF